MAMGDGTSALEQPPSLFEAPSPRSEPFAIAALQHNAHIPPSRKTASCAVVPACPPRRLSRRKLLFQAYCYTGAGKQPPMGAFKDSSSMEHTTAKLLSFCVLVASYLRWGHSARRERSCRSATYRRRCRRPAGRTLTAPMSTSLF